MSYVVKEHKVMALAELIEDLEIYPRHAVDDAHVRKLALALESGVDLPAVIVDAKSKRIVDGWHRCRARRRVYGDGATTEVELRSYPNEAEMVEDSIHLNAAHGRPMDAMDRTRAVLMLERYGVPMKRISLALHIPDEEVRKLTVRVAKAAVITDATVPHTKTITLKRPVAHMAGKTLTNEQAKAHDSMPGTSFLLLANQLVKAMQTELINRSDERLIAGLKELLTELKKFLA